MKKIVDEGLTFLKLQHIKITYLEALFLYVVLYP